MPEITRKDLIHFWMLTQNKKPLQTGFANYLKNFSDKTKADAFKKDLVQNLKKTELPDNLVIEDLYGDSALIREFLEIEDQEPAALIAETQAEALQLARSKQELPSVIKTGLDIIEPANFTSKNNLVLKRHQQGDYASNLAHFIALIKSYLTELNEHSTDLTLINQHLNTVPELSLLLSNLGYSLVGALRTKQLTLEDINEYFRTSLDQILIVRALKESIVKHCKAEQDEPEKSINNLITYFTILSDLNKTQLPKEYLLEVLEQVHSEFGIIGIFIADNFKNKALELYLSLLEQMIDSPETAARIEALVNHKDSAERNLDAYLEHAADLETSKKLGQLREKLDDMLPLDLDNTFSEPETSISKKPPTEKIDEEEPLSKEDLAALEAFRQQNSTAFNKSLFTSKAASVASSKLPSASASGKSTPKDTAAGSPPPHPKPK